MEHSSEEFNHLHHEQGVKSGKNISRHDHKCEKNALMNVLMKMYHEKIVASLSNHVSCLTDRGPAHSLLITAIQSCLLPLSPRRCAVYLVQHLTLCCNSKITKKQKTETERECQNKQKQIRPNCILN